MFDHVDLDMDLEINKEVKHVRTALTIEKLFLNLQFFKTAHIP